MEMEWKSSKSNHEKYTKRRYKENSYTIEASQDTNATVLRIQEINRDTLFGWLGSVRHLYNTENG